MTPTDAAVAPDQRLAAAFGAHVARWARAQGATADAVRITTRAAVCLSQATSNGHVCLDLAYLAAALTGEGTASLDVAALRERLLQSNVVGTAESRNSLPLILDGERLYLHRYFDYESRLAANLVARTNIRAGAGTGAGAALIAPDSLPPAVLALLERLFTADASEPATTDWQKIAVLTALLGRLTIISGGPGTGKTTAVVNLLACLLEASPGCRIALAAPTGKAAARLTEIIRQRGDHLPDHLRARLPTESSTIHRLLGGTPDGEFRHHAGNPLPIDVLVVDEASMLDLALAVHLLEAVPQAARVILLGDKDQLAAVESGAVFAELSARPAYSAQRIATLTRLCGASGLSPQRAPRSRLEDSVVWLRRNYRFAAGSAIGLLAADTNEGNAGRALDRLRSRADPSLIWLDDRGGVPSPESVQAILQGVTPYLEAVRDSIADPGTLTTAFSRFRILCAVRDGPWGVNAVNQRVGTAFRRTLQHRLDPGLRSEWYPGRPVMVLRNDNILKLFNGDIGIVLPDVHGTLQVWFPDEAGGYRAVAPVRLPQHETAFAMTVHKSQGSEFEEVLLMLPAGKNRALNRELLYTAVTRARGRLTIVANAAVLTHAIDTATKRVSGLTERCERIDELKPGGSHDV